MKVTVCCTYFKSLGLANLRAAAYSLRQQNLTNVDLIVVVDNDTDDSVDAIWNVFAWLKFPVPVRLLPFKHGDAEKTHSWSTNVAVRAAQTSWILFTRADYILDFRCLERFVAVAEASPAGWDGFVTGNVYHLNSDVGQCEEMSWRIDGAQVLRLLPGAEADYTRIDAGVWLLRRSAFDRVEGLDEALSAWGHAQTHFQHKLYTSGTEFVRVPEVLFYHPLHAAPRDLALAHQQLAERGIDLKEMWARHDGVQPY